MTPTAIEIIKQYLIDNDYDGLCNDDLECGCEIADLAPCCSDFSECAPGHTFVERNGKWIIVTREDALALKKEIK